MKKNILRLTLIVCLCLCHLFSVAQVKVTATAPSVVAEGEQFRVEYQVNSRQVESISMPKAIEGFDVLYGPSKSSSYSVQIINGKQTTSSSTTYGYTLSAQKTGTFTLPRMTVKVDGHSYTSNAVQVKVVTATPNNSGQPSQGQPSAHRQAVVGSNNNKIGANDLFITVTGNKSSVYEQEPVLLTYRVYARVNLVQLGGKMPDLKGFMVKEVPLPNQKSFSIESYKGQNYYTTIWCQYMMYPQQVGKLTIPSIKFEGEVEMPDPDVDPIEAFFNGTSSYKVKKVIVAPQLDIHVKPLPNKPADFSGAVGNFKVQSVLKSKQPKENESLTLQLIITGTGNVDLIKAPQIAFPAEFETYEPKQTANSKVSASGMTGTMTIDYTAVPRKKGHYTIPAVRLVYFDPASGSYKTVSTQPVELDVAKGERNAYSNSQQAVLANSDIRYIKTGAPQLKQQINSFWNKQAYWLYYLLVALAAVIVYGLLLRRDKNRGDVVGQRIRGASRLSMSRLKKARQLMKENSTDAFYEEVHRALTGYLADRLNIPLAEFSKENVRNRSAARQVPAATIESYLELLDACELYRYSKDKSQNDSPMTVFQQAVTMINEVESVLKKNKK